MSEIKVDSRGSACPGPITDLMKAYKNSKNGDIIEIMATDPGIKADAQAWAKKTQNEILSIEDKENYILIRILVKNKK
ncbi:MAG: sulfurtransferase TusA family protein [Thermoplasmata archaeon]|jgi:TusA-related sulfurtransferase